MTSLDDIDSALRFIPADDRDVWVRVGMAIKSELGDSGFRLWDYWSQSAASYHERAAELVWRSFKSGRTTIATLFHIAKEHGYRPDRKAPARAIPEKKSPPPQRVNTGVYAEQLWQRSDDSRVSQHPYAKAKGIDWAAGAARGVASGKVIGKAADCVIVPIRTIDTHKLTGVQCINPAGDKQTFGTVSGGGLVLGNTLDKSLYWFVCEGWATAVSLVFHHCQGNAVAAAAFGKSNMEKLANRIAEVYQPDRISILDEIDD